MKHFLLELTYLVPIETLETVLASHRAFLQTGYDKGWLLLSGPKNPRVGAVLIGRAPSLDEFKAFFINDPYQLNHYAEYSFSEFLPVKHQQFLTDWVNE